MRTALFALSLAAVLACSHEPKSASIDAVPDAGPASSARDAALDVAVASHEAALDYRGTLGTKTGIAVHLTVIGHDVKGSYVYTSLGRPIPLAGTVDASGAFVLTESAKGKVTGTLRLAPSSADLVGEWKSPDAKSAFPVHLSPGAPWTPVVPDAGGGRGFQAEACFADPLCLAVDAARWLVEADDAHGPSVDCYRFLDGAGLARDVKRGRACLERQVGAKACEPGSSGSLDGAQLASMLIDGVGGPADIPRARALFAGCFDDVTTTWVVGRADAKSSDPKAPAADICKDNAGTTLVSNDCGSRALTRTRTRVELQAKEIAASLEEHAKPRLVAAVKAYDAYVRARGEYGYEVFIEGTIRNAVFLAQQIKLYEARAKQLASFDKFVAEETSPADLARETKAVTTALAAVTTTTPGEAAALKKTEDTWETYRDAETAFYVAAFGPTQGSDRVQRAVRARLSAERAKQCGRPPM